MPGRARSVTPGKQNQKLCHASCDVQGSCLFSWTVKSSFRVLQDALSDANPSLGRIMHAHERDAALESAAGSQSHTCIWATMASASLLSFLLCLGLCCFAWLLQAGAHIQSSIKW